MPISYSNGPSDNPPLNGIDATGLAFAAVGLMMEAIADQTKFIFKYVLCFYNLAFALDLCYIFLM